MVEDILESRCKDQDDGWEDALCSAMTMLCFEVSQKTFDCDTRERPIEDQVFIAPTIATELAENYQLKGSAYLMEPREANRCYLHTPMLDRIDEESEPYFDLVISKKIYVADPKEPPALEVEPPLKWYMGAGEAFEIPFSSFADPDGGYVLFSVNFRFALEFARFDYEQMKIVVDKRATTLEKDAGVYPITVKLTPTIRGA